MTFFLPALSASFLLLSCHLLSVTMSSTNNFTFDAWDAALAALEPIRPASFAGATPSGSSTSGSSSLLTPTTQASGEFQPFTLIGWGEWGGGVPEDFCAFLFSWEERCMYGSYLRNQDLSQGGN